MPPDLSIVIPAYAEVRYLGRTLDALHAHLFARGALQTTEIIVVTADAPDGTAALAKTKLAAFPKHLHVEPGAKVGKGRDVRAGMLAATGAIVVFMDADMATPLHHIDRFVEAIGNGADLAIGTRDLAHIHGDWMRSASSQVANRLVQLLLLPGIPDTQCGFKAFRGELVRELFEPLETMGWGFDFEVLGRARLGGYRTECLPISDWHDPKGNEGLVGEAPWRASLRTLRELLRAWMRLNGPIARMERERRAVAADEELRRARA